MLHDVLFQELEDNNVNLEIGVPTRIKKKS